MNSSPRAFVFLASLSLILAAPLRAQNLDTADTNRDGFVTRAELLSAHFLKSPGSTTEVRTAFADSTLERLDSNRDGKLTKEEIAAGVPKPGTVVVERANAQNAQAIMSALAVYRKGHYGIAAPALTDLVKAGLIGETVLSCNLPDGKKASWNYTPAGQKPLDLNAVLIYSPGPVDAAGHMIIGMGDGRVVGIKAENLDMRKAPTIRIK